MNNQAPYLLLIEEGLPFGPPELQQALLPVRVWHCSFDTLFYQDEEYRARGIALPESIASASVKRRAEYLAGRILCDRLLAEFGYPGFVLLPGEDRAPCWPENLYGAISHHASTAVALVGKRSENGIGGVGIDIETLIAPAKALELWSGIINVAERQYLDTLSLPFAVSLTLAFSAKETLFKALYPSVRRYFDFLDAQVIDLTASHITLQLLVGLSPEVTAGMRFECAYARHAEDVITLLSLNIG
ncbi:4'-phosphopantetheinyl transferase family protein [Biostraticola tofi]|uniref:Enterobactin synthase component D n=1 Tax=Biostraticola tofi TaxID=466109 RepID=A0A4R3Z5W2_9GAMM|nr:4'-phosphopantetheinyl transferase superfamily protein [Biostraticola tofi]TCW00469.1 4'-phosphopantetheinyl transferase EntD [Biostraticola tofi]